MKNPYLNDLFNNRPKRFSWFIIFTVILFTTGLYKGKSSIHEFSYTGKITNYYADRYLPKSGDKTSNLYINSSGKYLHFGFSDRTPEEYSEFKKLLQTLQLGNIVSVFGYESNYGASAIWKVSNEKNQTIFQLDRESIKSLISDQTSIGERIHRYYSMAYFMFLLFFTTGEYLNYRRIKNSNAIEYLK